MQLIRGPKSAIFIVSVNELFERSAALDELNESIDWLSIASRFKENLNFKDRS